jgi:hypothetical protein
LDVIWNAIGVEGHDVVEINFNVMVKAIVSLKPLQCLKNSVSVL